MHYVIGLITAVAAFLFALNRLQNAGLDLNALNPFLWYRRAQWQKKYASKPLYSLTRPMDSAALLVLATAKCEGEISSTQKRAILRVYEDEFHLTRDQAADLFVASAFLLKDELSVAGKLDKILERSRRAFTPEQVHSTLELMEQVGRIDGPRNAEQERLLRRTAQILDAAKQAPGKWD
jgi:uncharacterized tellurite resistance protein B-like protein